MNVNTAYAAHTVDKKPTQSKTMEVKHKWVTEALKRNLFNTQPLFQGLLWDECDAYTVDKNPSQPLSEEVAPENETVDIWWMGHEWT